MSFWIVAGALALICAGLMGLALLRRRSAAVAMERFDIQVYRDQLSSVDKDLARGVVTEDEAERIRTEVKRRILEADKATQDETQRNDAPESANMVAALVGGLVVIGGSLWAYSQLGAPGYPDLPLQARLDMAQDARENRPSQTQAEAQVPPVPSPEISSEFADLMDQLRSAVAERPDDLQGHVLLARNEAGLGRFVEARAAQEQVLRIKGDGASGQDYADLGDLMVLSAGGYVSPEAERAFEAALARDPRNGTARYYLGLMQIQTGRPDIGFRIWEAQLREGPDTAPWIPPIRDQIEEAAFRAGVDYTPPVASSAQRGPSQDDVAAAESMSPIERMQMIEGMVGGLSDRLANEGGTPEEWAQLIRALGVLGRLDQARAIWSEAQTVFPDPGVQVPILRAARDAGIEQ